MADYTIPVFNFDALASFGAAGAIDVSGLLWASTFGSATGELVVTDEDANLDAIDITQSAELSIAGVQLGTFNVGTLAKITISWQGDSGPQTTELVSIYGAPNIVTVVNGPIPPDGTMGTVLSGEVFVDVPYVDLLCFTRGTMILTDRGEVAIEDLSAGDTVLTRDNAAQPIRWISSRTTSATGEMAPIKISAGALGNDRDLTLSPAHRVLLSGWRAQAICGQSEALATARQLLAHDGVSRVEGGTVEYFHMLLDRHEIVTANGTPAETLNPSDLALDALGSEQRREIETLFPELLTGEGFPLARPMLRDADVAALAPTA